MTKNTLPQHWPVRVDKLYGCWVWTARRDRDGYGRFNQRLAYRVVYETEVGAIPDGMMLDHICRNRACVNPAHLEPVDQRENERRKRWRNRVARETCGAGHRLSDVGIVTPQGGRVCRLCARETQGVIGAYTKL